MTRFIVGAFPVKCAACSLVLGHPNCPEEMEEVFVNYENHLIIVHKVRNYLWKFI